MPASGEGSAPSLDSRPCPEVVRDRAVPCVCIEEHHEAYLAWMRAIATGELQASRYVLLHVDEHADWGIPRTAAAVPVIDAPMEEHERYTYQALTIGDFIWPAVYHGFIGTVVWKRRQPARNSKARHMYVWQNPGGGLVTGEHRQWFASDQYPERRDVVYQVIGDEEELGFEGEVLLDIDLDYFASHRFPHLCNARIQVTAEQYEAFTADPYHFLKISPGRKPRAVRDADGYYLDFSDVEPPQFVDERPVSEEIARERVRIFFAWLDQYVPVPKFITVCRSRTSGYTPGSIADVLEREVLSALAARFPLRMFELGRR